MNELELILTDIFKCSRSDLYLRADSLAFKDKELRSLERILKQRGETKPIQYILGHTEFMGLRFNTKKGAFIPRPETEILIEATIQESSQINKKRKLHILDIGTGSGCIAVSLAKFLGNVDIVALDISKQALALARDNAKLNGVERKIRFLESDLFNHNFFKTGVKFDMIVSNPPYVATSEVGLFDRTTENEPKIALDGGRDGFDFYRRISKHAGKFLKSHGLLLLELGYAQHKGIKDIFSSGWQIQKIIVDYQNIDRVCILKKR